MREDLCGEISISKMNHLILWLKNNPSAKNIIGQAKAKMKAVEQELRISEHELEQQKFQRRAHIRAQNELLSKT